jgi:hypothetical protein
MLSRELMWWSYDEGMQDVLRWQPSDTEIQPPADLLARFVRLADAPPRKIATFAASYGVLGICEHGDVWTHWKFSTSPFSYDADCAPLLWKKDHGFWEPLSSWRLYSGQARAMLNIAACLHGNPPKCGRIEDWARLGKFGGELGNIDHERFCLATAVNIWILDSSIRPYLEWGRFYGRDNGSVGMVLANTKAAAGGLFGALSVQLAMAVARSEGLAICSACGAAYIPPRRPRVDENNYCESCGKRAAWRNAARRYRAQKKRRATDQERRHHSAPAV